jgi:hypothetical protein
LHTKTALQSFFCTHVCQERSHPRQEEAAKTLVDRPAGIEYANIRYKYVRVAVELTHDREWLSALRAGQGECIARSPLCDSVRFTHLLEEAYHKKMWETWCRNATQ